MRAIVAETFGGPEVLQVRDIPMPSPQAGEVRVRVKAAGINPVDVQTRRGDYASHVHAPFRLGVDIAGVVDAIGDNVENFKLGDEVFYAAQALSNEGGYAEYHVEKADMMVLKPASISFAQAVSIPIAAQTAWDCLFERVHLQPAESALILGGTGSVGIAAVQLAKAAGASVVLSCSGDKAGFAREIGANAAVDYKASDAQEQFRQLTPGGYDVVFDGIGGYAIQDSLGLLAPRGRLVSVFDHATPQNLLAGWLANASLHLMFLTPNGRRMAQVASMVQRGLLTPVVERILRLDEAAEAHRLIEAGGRKGKIVLDCS